LIVEVLPGLDWPIPDFFTAILGVAGMLVLAVWTTVLVAPIWDDVPEPGDSELEVRVGVLLAGLRESVSTIEEIDRLLTERSQRAAEAKVELEKLEALGEIESRQAEALLATLREHSNVATRKSRRDAVLINAGFLSAGLAIGFFTR